MAGAAGRLLPGPAAGGKVAAGGSNSSNRRGGAEGRGRQGGGRGGRGRSRGWPLSSGSGVVNPPAVGGGFLTSVHSNSLSAVVTSGDVLCVRTAKGPVASFATAVSPQSSAGLKDSF